MTGDRAGSWLPPVAQARLAEISGSGTWGSALTTSEFAAIRSVGFEPVGQVLGAAVYNVGYTGGYGCPGGFSAGLFRQPLVSVTQVSGAGGLGSFAALTKTMYEARYQAIGRMIAECAALGGHGIVGVSLSMGQFPAGGLEFRAIGTAVRGQGAQAPPRPFSSDLSGQDFAKLVTAGWVPVGLALGISIGARHDDWRTRGQTYWGAGSTEVDGYTELVGHARHDARQQLEREVRQLGADGVVIASMDMRISERECPAQESTRDHIAEVTIVGTATARFADHPQRRPGSLAIMSLDPQRRQAARVRLGGPE